MKNILVALLFIVAVPVWGQTYDTIYNRSDELYYSEWYDTACVFYDSSRPCCLFSYSPGSSNTPVRYEAFSGYTSRPLQVRGLALMHTIDYSQNCTYLIPYCLDTSRVPEYVALYQWDGDSLLWLATVRWDTATPQVLKLPKKQDTSLYGFEYCYLYRVYFDTPITVDSVFYIAGSVYNNIYRGYEYFIHRPTRYVGMGRGSYMDRCSPRYNERRWADNDKGPFHSTYPVKITHYGPFFPIAPVTSCLLELHTADSMMGSVQGGGWYLDSSYITITAVAERGYRFAHWDDGDTTNPRTILLMHDTSFTAYFEEAYCTLAATADPADGGTVTGGGTYRDGDTATLAAIPNEGYAFVGWHDGDTARTRLVELTQDTSFTAQFRSTQGIVLPGTDGLSIALTPNPTQGSCLLEVSDGLAAYSDCWVTVTDAQGREMLRQQVLSRMTTLATDRLATGVYMVTLSTPRGSASQRLVVK